MTPREDILHDLVNAMSATTRQAVAEYAPLVDAIVSGQSRDIRRIEHTLDGLLDFCFDPEALILFKKLCRHYYAIDPTATADHVRLYREMWDSEAEVQP
jgi:hypothetical protein